MAISIKINKNSQSRINTCDFNNIEFGKIFSDHMFRVDYENGEWQTGEILPYGNISFSPALYCLSYDHGFHEVWWRRSP